MPEYLAPGVYVEEVPSGNRPIEGVSTSTAAFVGVAERGPVNEPTLVTSFADYNRKFGGYLDHRVFTDDRDLLPYAVEGFFINGGSRLYVTRIAGDGAAFATVDLLGNAFVNPASTT
jgi:phage tail sheath protein FI